jgi:hypothetical protein
MLFLIYSLAIAGHPTDVLPISSAFKKEGLQVIVGGDITGSLIGNIEDNGKPMMLSFLDNGAVADPVKGDGIYVAFLPIQQRGGSANASLKMAGKELWTDQIPIGSDRSQFILKIFIKAGHAVVKVDTFDIKKTQPIQNGNDRPPKPSKPMLKEQSPPQDPSSNSVFYENVWFLQTLSVLFFLTLGLLLGKRWPAKQQFSTRRPLGKKENNVPHPIIGKQQCWACQTPGPHLYQLSQALMPQGSVILALSNRSVDYFEEQHSTGGVYFCQERTSNSDIVQLCRHLEKTGAVILLVDGLGALEHPSEGEEPEAVLKDLIYDLPNSISLLALINENNNLEITHRL